MREYVLIRKKGFTLLEVLIAMFILVIVFGLITYLYVKAASVRKIVVANSETQQVLSQMVDTILHGKKDRWGLTDASVIRSISDATGSETEISGTTLVAYNDTRNETMVVRIASEEELKGGGNTLKTLWVNWYSSPFPPSNSSFYTNEALIDINEKIELTDNSFFSYYDSRGRNILDEGLNTETTLVKIKLEALSTDPTLSNKNPTLIETSMRLKNSFPF